MQKRWVGEVTHITRYPVKSMAGESLTRTAVAAYGLYGDRSHALVDPAKQGWERYITARQIPRLLGYRPTFLEQSTEGEFPQLQIASPDGRTFGWDEQLLSELGSLSNRTMTMIRHQPDSVDLLAVDTGAILLITDRSLRKLERLTGREIDPRRFRANIVVSLHEDATEDETGWIGKELSIGGCRLQIEEPCERCSVITLDPDTYERDVKILKQVNEQMNLIFGVYASVTAVGDVGVGDRVYVGEQG
ncbi:MOSC domain-containing protein [Paenibacillus oceani]|uniref:MOSC domain-containing protein n=1 Tax=Paenibacillus oceani TaxID=2772510 RepID=A0A927C820_9BACL|nr:MOSC domain-containing protein [Paenibacillus oceani]MBD2863114.1 MOSC domain-containing protein [Paenibacillus oceani]